ATHQLRAGEPVLHAQPLDPAVLGTRGANLPREVHVPAGPFTMGSSVEPWALDNERPAHEVHVPGYWIDTVPVSNAEFAGFVADGGYDRKALWSPVGWTHRQRTGLGAPGFWRREGGQWWRRRFGVE